MKVGWGIGGILSVALVALALLALPANGQDAGSEQTMESLREELCAGANPCRAINTLAETQAGAEGPIVVSDALDVYGRPAADCPEAAEAYAAVGEPVDAFIGPCPESSSLPRSGT